MQLNLVNSKFKGPKKVGLFGDSYMKIVTAAQIFILNYHLSRFLK
jgi:hypothetical protein